MHYGVYTLYYCFSISASFSSLVLICGYIRNVTVSPFLRTVPSPDIIRNVTVILFLCAVPSPDRICAHVLYLTV